MILVDTSVWVDHLRSSHAQLRSLLDRDMVVTHPFVVGELACGSLKNRERIISDVRALPAAAVAAQDEVLRFVEERRLWNKGLGWIDVHLLASALLSNCRLLTLDRSLLAAATAMGLSYS